MERYSLAFRDEIVMCYVIQNWFLFYELVGRFIEFLECEVILL